MVCRKRSCYDTRNCFIDSLASCLHILQFVTWPISIFQADVDKNPSAPHTRLHFVMTWRMHGGRGRGPRRAATFFLLPVPAVLLLLLLGEGRWWKGIVTCPVFPPDFTGLGPPDASGLASPQMRPQGSPFSCRLFRSGALQRPGADPPPRGEPGPRLAKQREPSPQARDDQLTQHFSQVQLKFGHRFSFLHTSRHRELTISPGYLVYLGKVLFL